MAQYPANIPLAGLSGSTSGSPGFQITGEVAGDNAGHAVALAGDVNGDGFDDFIIGANEASPNGPGSGAAYLVFGKAAGFGNNVNLSTLNGTNGFQISGKSAGDGIGASVASAGDVNGDGFDDILIGAYEADPNGTDSGATYVVFGKSGGFTSNFDLSALNGTNGFQVSGVIGTLSGRSVASAGDINGDGFDDFIIGAPSVNINGAESGASYVVFGKASGFSANLKVVNLVGSNGFRILGQSANDYSGFSVSSAGDVNRDGFDDLIIGAFGADPNRAQSGASYVVFGKATGFTSTLQLSSLNGSNGFKISGEALDDRSGNSVSSAGDVNGDGFADLIIGASRVDQNGTDSGGAYVVFGKASGFAANINLSALNGKNGFQINGELTGHRAGISVSSAGDVNGDGFDDLLVGSFLSSPNGSGSGAAFVVLGKSGGFGANINLATLNGTTGFQISGEAAGDRTGFSVSGGGDINGDGLGDIIIGTGRADNSSLDKAHVILGRKPDAAVNRTGTAADQTIVGGDFNDTLNGGAGKDKLIGNGGNDLLDGGNDSDADILNGGSGNDTYIWSSNTTIIDASGVDTISSNEALSLTSFSAIENLTLTGSQHNGATGNSLANTLTGNNGRNTMDGQGGSDVLIGGNGNDQLGGGAGNDTLTGGGNADTFVFFAALNAANNVDTITDFSAPFDTILLENTGAGLFTALPVGALAASAFKSNASGTATDADDRIVYNTATGALIYDSNGSAAGGTIQFAVLTGKPAISADDFLVY